MLRLRYRKDISMSPRISARVNPDINWSNLMELIRIRGGTQADMELIYQPKDQAAIESRRQ